MGATIGAAAVAAGHDVVWLAAGRSNESHERADAAGLVGVGTLPELVEQSEIVISVCPPSAAGQVAESVRALEFRGIYLDANAVSPQSARQICAGFTEPVDGGIVGPPVNGPGTTRLYVSGEQACQIADLFVDSDLEVRLVEGDIGAASAVKMCFAAWTKGTSALLFAITALAEAEGITDSLTQEWMTSMPELLGRAEHSPSRVGPKAWRFAGEMEEIASTFAANELPAGFHLAAADVYERLASLKGTSDASLAEVIELLNR